MKRKFQEVQCQQPPRKMQRIVMSSLPDRMLKKKTDNEQPSPDQTVAQLLRANNVQAQIQPFSALHDFFHAPTQAEIDAYDHDVLTAIRSQDLKTLREYHAAGRPLKCSNKFGESLLHMACRKNMVQVTTVLVKEANVPFQVCDDYGRNPLHDACWAATTNFELIDLILTECPDLLYIQDKRGNTPLSYLRKDKWASWNAYLQKKSVDFLKPKSTQLLL